MPKMLCKGNAVLPHLQMEVALMGELAKFMKMHFLPHLESFMQKRKFENTFLKKTLIQPPNGCFPFANYGFKMWVTVMGFAEYFGHYQLMAPTHKNFWIFTMNLIGTSLVFIKNRIQIMVKNALGYEKAQEMYNRIRNNWCLESTLCKFLKF